MKPNSSKAISLQSRSPKPSTVSYSKLRRYLEELGFKEVAHKSGRRLVHPPTDTEFLFRRYRAADLVYVHDLFQVRSQLDWRGLVAAEAFDQSLEKRPA